jgi:hypothetical protein
MIQNNTELYVCWRPPDRHDQRQLWETPYLDAETSKLVENTKATEKENNHKGGDRLPLL